MALALVLAWPWTFALLRVEGFDALHARARVSVTRPESSHGVGQDIDGGSARVRSFLNDFDEDFDEESGGIWQAIACSPWIGSPTLVAYPRPPQVFSSDPIPSPPLRTIALRC